MRRKEGKVVLAATVRVNDKIIINHSNSKTKAQISIRKKTKAQILIRKKTKAQEANQKQKNSKKKIFFFQIYLFTTRLGPTAVNSSAFVTGYSICAVEVGQLRSERESCGEDDVYPTLFFERRF